MDDNCTKNIIATILILTQTLFSGCPVYPQEAWTGKLVSCEYRFPKKNELTSRFSKGVPSKHMFEEIKKHEGLILEFDHLGEKRLVFNHTVDSSKCSEFKTDSIYHIISRRSCGMAFESPFAWGFNENLIQIKMQ